MDFRGLYIVSNPLFYLYFWDFLGGERSDDAVEADFAVPLWPGGLRADLTAPLDAMGIPRGELRLNGLVQNTRATDPVTGRSRRFSEETEWNYSVDIRQPLPRLQLLWGVSYERTDSTQLFRLREQRTNHWDAPSIDLFVESTAIKNALVRFTVADILRPTDVRERRFFTPDRTRAQNLTSVETRAATGGFGTRSYTLRVSGRF